jgi:hypothetical protein
LVERSSLSWPEYGQKKESPSDLPSTTNTIPSDEGLDVFGEIDTLRPLSRVGERVEMADIAWAVA